MPANPGATGSCAVSRFYDGHTFAEAPSGAPDMAKPIGTKCPEPIDTSVWQNPKQNFENSHKKAAVVSPSDRFGPDRVLLLAYLHQRKVSAIIILNRRWRCLGPQAPGDFQDQYCGLLPLVPSRANYWHPSADQIQLAATIEAMGVWFAATP